MMRRAAAGALACSAALLMVSCVYPTRPIPWDDWLPPHPPQYEIPLERKMERIESHLLERHLSPEGVLIYERPDRPFEPDQPGGYQNLADEADWTGALLAAFAFKFAVTKAPPDRENLIRVIRGVLFLERVTGRSGLLSRAISRAGVPIPNERPDQEWRQAARPHEAYRYRGDVSRDQYFGVLLGFAAVAATLNLGASAGDAEIRGLLAPAAAAIADHIWDNRLRIIDADGKVTKFGDLSPYFLGIIPIGQNAMLCLGWQLVAGRLTGEQRFLDRYRIFVERGYHEATGLNKYQILGDTNHSNDVMSMMGFYSLIILERDPAIRDVYRRRLIRLWSQVLNEGNLFFHCVYGAVSGRRLPAAQRRDFEEGYRLIPVDLTLAAVDLTGDPRVRESCLRGRKGARRNQTALPLHVRPLDSFIWKSSPYALLGNQRRNPEPRTVSGMDFLLVYWMARYHGLL